MNWNSSPGSDLNGGAHVCVYTSHGAGREGRSLWSGQTLQNNHFSRRHVCILVSHSFVQLALTDFTVYIIHLKSTINTSTPITPCSHTKYLFDHSWTKSLRSWELHPTKTCPQLAREPETISGHALTSQRHLINSMLCQSRPLMKQCIYYVEC